MTALYYLEKLLAFYTIISHPNADLIARVKAQLEPMGATVQIIENAEGSKANPFATIGPSDHGGVMLSGRTDVVPVVG
jgi:acetylornithine deacetylase